MECVTNVPQFGPVYADVHEHVAGSPSMHVPPLAHESVSHVTVIVDVYYNHEIVHEKKRYILRCATCIADDEPALATVVVVPFRTHVTFPTHILEAQI